MTFGRNTVLNIVWQKLILLHKIRNTRCKACRAGLYYTWDDLCSHLQIYVCAVTREKLEDGVIEVQLKEKNYFSLQ